MKDLLKKIHNHESLSVAEAELAMELIMTGKANPVHVSALLMGLAMKGESKEELVGMLKVMREKMTTINLGESILDTCGTGGDNSNTFNISTATALCCAALGVKVAKHGNRAASSKCGSADILEALKIPIDLKPAAAKRYFKQNNFVFLFAPLYHPAMKYVVPIRQTMAIRTIFNFLGPLANPALTKHQMIGVSDPMKAEIIGQALIELGSQHVIVVFSDDGLDEASVSADTTVLDFKPDSFKRYRISPRQRYELSEIKGGEAKENAKILKQLANGEGSAALIEVIAMNTGLALYAADFVDSYESGKKQAEQLLRSHKLSDYLNQLCQS